jgi:hypothetical protein
MALKGIPRPSDGLKQRVAKLNSTGASVPSYLSSIDNGRFSVSLIPYENYPCAIFTSSLSSCNVGGAFARAIAAVALSPLARWNFARVVTMLGKNLSIAAHSMLGLLMRKVSAFGTNRMPGLITLYRYAFFFLAQYCTYRAAGSYHNYKLCLL